MSDLRDTLGYIIKLIDEWNNIHTYCKVNKLKKIPKK